MHIQVEVETPTVSGRIPLVRVRNPWGDSHEWKGAWSDEYDALEIVLMLYQCINARIFSCTFVSVIYLDYQTIPLAVMKLTVVNGVTNWYNLRSNNVSLSARLSAFLISFHGFSLW